MYFVSLKNDFPRKPPRYFIYYNNIMKMENNAITNGPLTNN